MSGNRKFKKVALDSNIFIYQFEQNVKFTIFTNKIINRLDQGEYQGITSIISVIEALSYPSPPKILDLIVESFNSIPNLKIIDINWKISLLAAQIRREYGFRLPDAVQLATAVNAKAQIFITNDARLKSFKQLEVLKLSDLRD